MRLWYTIMVVSLVISSVALGIGIVTASFAVSLVAFSIGSIAAIWLMHKD